ncbi:hypothetical protein EYR41_011909 [Orbilia oligospora]|uniref:Sulfhydryl oxidase n=1 Tax=Orbilia oligospora TaxID=2813651 RepID=A0A7C8K8E6_ORBOL|nr:hypothetical protein TWF751_008200 [Orbilia oligospora]TGJ62722.1 hypothetical protein EYR41_011909 [Orbilia oligospora]
MTVSDSADNQPSSETSHLPQPPAHKGTISKSGIVLGPDGKPCRTCNSARDMTNLSRMLTSGKGKASPLAAAIGPPPVDRSDCPPDVEQLGRSTWTFLHSITATYPEEPSQSQKSDMQTFLSILGRVYPCWVCADDFTAWMKQPDNSPKLDTQEDFGRWMCKAHNEVNRKLGKQEFDCNLWKQRWKDGWKDGRCD